MKSQLKESGEKNICKMKRIALFLMGCGGVGLQLIQHIIACRTLHSKMGLRLSLLGVSDSKSLVTATNVISEELDDALLVEICRIKSNGLSLLSLASVGSCQIASGIEITKKSIGIAALLGTSTGLVFIDCSASSETVGMLELVVDLGCFVVMANKKPLTSSLESYDKLNAQPRRIRHESTVGAGLPVIVSLTRMVNSGDPIYHIVGSLSGTLGYVMSVLESGKPFSEVVNQAKSLGYTEPDPRDDLSGMDVARKGLILARLLGHRLNMDDIEIESLYPAEMAPNLMSVSDFLIKGLPLLDKSIQDRITLATLNGNVLRYVCSIKNGRCSVGIQELAKDSPLGRLKGSDNLLEIYSRCYKEQPLVIQGAGAGNDTTAAGVLADILDFQLLFS